MYSKSVVSASAATLSLVLWVAAASADAKFTVQSATAQGSVHVTGNHTLPPFGSNTADATFTYPTQIVAKASVTIPNALLSGPLDGWSGTSFTSVNLSNSDSDVLPPIGQPTSSVYVQLTTQQMTALGSAASGSLTGIITATSHLVLDAPSRWKFDVEFSNTGSSSKSLHSMEITGPNGFDVLYSGGLLDQQQMFDLLPGNYTITGSQDVAFTATWLAFSFPNVTPCFDESMFNASWVSDAPEPASLAILLAGIPAFWSRRRASPARPPC